jgi:hypothetical protein
MQVAVPPPRSCLSFMADIAIDILVLAYDGRLSTAKWRVSFLEAVWIDAHESLTIEEWATIAEATYRAIGSLRPLSPSGAEVKSAFAHLIKTLQSVTAPIPS